MKLEKEREARRLQMERVLLHRELGVAEDATHFETVQATKRLIEAAGDDLKQKVKIEIARDKLMDIRLEERMAGVETGSRAATLRSSLETR